MGITLSAEQTMAWDLLEDANPEAVNKDGLAITYGGAAGGGKSYLGCLWQIARRIKYPGTRGYMARKVLKRLKESTLETFYDVAAEQGIEYRYNEQKGRIYFPNGSQIFLLEMMDKPGDPDFSNVGSTEFTDGFIDEVTELSERAVLFLWSRTRYKVAQLGLTPKQLRTCNPMPGWVKDKVYVPYMEGTLGGIDRFIEAKLDSNPDKDFADQYRRNLEQMEEYDKARLLHADWFAEPRTGGEAYHKFTQQANVRECHYDPEQPLHLSFDFNTVPYITLLLYQLDGRDSRQVGEICLKDPRANTMELCREFKAQYHNHQGGVFIYGDPAGRAQDTRSIKGHNDYRIIINELAQYHPQLRVDTKAPSVVARIAFINELFSGNIEGCSAVVDPSCDNTRRDYNQVKQAADGTKHKRKVKDPRTGVSYEPFGHCSDAADYYYIRIFTTEYARYIAGPAKPQYKLGRKTPKHGY